MPTLIHRSRFLLPIAAIFLLVAVLVPIRSARAEATFVVDTVVDDVSLAACTLAAGDCSLRGAVAAANTTPGADIINFDVPAPSCPGGVCRITLTDGPLRADEAVTIDGTTQPQNGGPQANVCATATEPSHMRIEVVADPTAAFFDHVFYLNHGLGASTIRGFAIGTDRGGMITGGVYALDGHVHHIECNHFALDAAGQTHLGTADFFAGILIDLEPTGVVIGTDGDGVNDIGERNVFASGEYSIYINRNDDNTIAGNYFGFTADGATNIGAGPVLVRQESSNNIIGTNEDGVSDELERNYFGNNLTTINLTTASLELPATGAGVPTNQWVVGNSFGISPTGVTTTLRAGIDVISLDADETGWEIRSNTFAAAPVAISISGDEAGASVLIADNVFGTGLGGVAAPNETALALIGAGSHVLRDNAILNSTTAAITFDDTAGLGSGSADNCVVGNTLGVVNNTGVAVGFENNWWGATDGPSGAGPGSGDSVSADVDFTPWLTNPPAQCNTAPVASDATFTVKAGAPVGTLVGTVSVVDDGTDLLFAITAGDPSAVFGIDPETGEIVKEGTPNYPVTSSYSLTVDVRDGLLSDIANVTIDITNSAPVISDATFAIAEDAALGAPVGTVVATDGDSDPLEYLIVAGDSAGAFAIDSAGLVTVADPLDYETRPSYSLTVSADDGFEPDTAAVTVTVTDVLDTATFGDVPLTHTFFGDIEWLAAAGVTKGCNPPANDLFCPDASVTRGQMAAFLHRALAGTLTVGPAPDFTDAAGSVFAADIIWLGAVGVTKGCNPPVNDQFCPDAVVTRQQMAAFLVRALGYTAGAGSDAFSDDDGSIFEADIERLAEAGVTRGCNPPTNDLFCPSSAVTRAQMAAFLYRALGP